MKLDGPQGRVLEALRKSPGATAEELARELGGGPVAMRVHLRSLLRSADSCVSPTEVRPLQM